MSKTNDVIVLLVGPSGSGKSTIADALSNQYGWKQVASYTTRPPRYDGERGHTFISDAEFDTLEIGKVIAYTEFDGHRYCATTDQVEDADVYVVDLAGCETLKDLYHGKKKVLAVYVHCPPDERLERLIKRDGYEAAKRRVEYDRGSFTNGWARLAQLFDRVVIAFSSFGTPEESAKWIAEQVSQWREDG